MSIQNQHPISRRLAIAVCVSTLVGLGAAAPAIQAADGGLSAAAGAPLILADTNGMDRRDDRQDDRQGDRDNRQDTRDECRDEKGAGKDKRDCKQEGRKENHGKDDKEGGDKTEG